MYAAVAGAGSVGASGFPARKRLTLRYSTFEVLQYNAGAQFAQLDFRANSLYDPEYAVGGHQPMGFDQWMKFYKNYTVLRSRIKIASSPSTNTNLTPAEGCIILNSDVNLGSFGLDYNAVCESPLACEPRSMGVISGGLLAMQLSHAFDAKQFFDIKSKEVDPTIYGGTNAANPNEEAYFTFAYRNPDITNSSGSIWVRVMIEYDCEFSEPIPLIGS